MKYRKKPVVIEAIKWNGIAFALGEMPDWFIKALHKDMPTTGAIKRDEDKLLIGTLEGVMTANPNDWIIQGVKGEIYPCKPDIFEATYEKVKD